MRDWDLIQGECLPALHAMADNSVDAIITDPPYSSGGFSRDDKGKDPDAKYTQSSSQGRYPTFSGDSRDQRSYLAWSALWIAEAVRVLKPGGYFLAFTDWRQLPVMTDAVQAGGVFWRGVIAWDKGRGSRAPHKGYFRHQCEYVIWGPKGAAVQLEHDGPFDGCIQATVKRDDKHHLTGKPTALMKELVRPGAWCSIRSLAAGPQALQPYSQGAGSSASSARPRTLPSRARGWKRPSSRRPAWEISYDVL